MLVTLNGSNVGDYGQVTPNDGSNLPKTAIGIMVTGTAGTIVVTKPNGTDVTIPATIATVGTLLPFPVIRVKLTGTTATGIWAVYG